MEINIMISQRLHLWQLVILLLTVMMAQGQDTVQWEIDSCRITTATDGTYLLCEEQADCAAQNVGSNVNCSVYTYKVISNVTECIGKCCWELNPVPTSLTGSLTQQCYDQSQFRYKIYVIKIVFIVFGVVGFFVAIGATYLFGFVKNPYTSRRVWIGCCCCKRVPDFEADRQWIQSQGRYVDKMEQQKARQISAQQLQNQNQNQLQKNQRKIRKVLAT